MAALLVIAASLVGLASAVLAAAVFGLGWAAALGLWMGAGLLVSLAGLALAACPGRDRDRKLRAERA
jgi:hypothetical protein